MFSVCVGVMGEVWFSFFSYVSFHASVLYTCFSIQQHKVLAGVIRLHSHVSTDIMFILFHTYRAMSFTFFMPRLRVMWFQKLLITDRTR